MSETIEQTATVATAQPAPTEMSITTGTLSEMFLSLDGHDKAQPGYDWRKGWNDAIRQAMDYAQPAPSVPTVAAAAAMGAKGGHALEGERLAFEAWVRGHGWSLCARWNGEGYVGDLEQGGAVCPQAMRTRMMWAAWRDRAALAPEAKS